MNTLKGLKYSKTHEWVKVDGETAMLGITDFAQDSLGDIVYIEMPEPGMKVSAGKDFGVIESVKAVSDLNTPVSGKVLEVNGELAETPENVNSAPYESWIIKVELSDKTELEQLMDEAAYIEFCKTEE